MLTHRGIRMTQEMNSPGSSRYVNPTAVDCRLCTCMTMPLDNIKLITELSFLFHIRVFCSIENESTQFPSYLKHRYLYIKTKD